MPDLWAFGAVLFELLSGTRAFESEDIADTQGKVLKMEPDWSPEQRGGRRGGKRGAPPPRWRRRSRRPMERPCCSRAPSGRTHGGCTCGGSTRSTCSGCTTGPTRELHDILLPDGAPSSLMRESANVRGGSGSDSGVVVLGAAEGLLTPADDGSAKVCRSGDKPMRYPEFRGVASNVNLCRADFSIADNGALAWRPGRVAEAQLTAFDRRGNELGTMGPPGAMETVWRSPGDDSRCLTSEPFWRLGTRPPAASRRRRCRSGVARRRQGDPLRA